MHFINVLSLAALAAVNAEKVVPIFDSAPHPDAEKAFNEVYESAMATFPIQAHQELVEQVNATVSSFLESQAFVGAPGESSCGSSGSMTLPKKISAFPGGATKRVFGMDLAKLVDNLASKASGKASAMGLAPSILAMEAIQAGAGLVKTGMNVALQIIPRVVPPNQPLSCMPMVTGHNCFGAVLYPITMADFATADMTDSQLDGVIAGFPGLYKRKVGVTSDVAYKACFSSYMSMQCGSIFPRCNVPLAGNEPGPTGRLPLCFTSCIATLVACPGLWVDDIMGECASVSVPPMCTLATYANFWRMPPQYSSYEASLATDQSCPSVSAGLSDAVSSRIYDEDSIESSAYGSGRLPSA